MCAQLSHQEKPQKLFKSKSQTCVLRAAAAAAASVTEAEAVA